MSKKDEQCVHEKASDGDSMNGASNQTGPGDFALSLVHDDLLNRLQRRIGLIPARGAGIVRRAVFWSLFAWLPIALWAWYTGRALPPAVNEPFLTQFGIHVRSASQCRCSFSPRLLHMMSVCACSPIL